jgi:glutamate decarboxylase
VDSNTAAVQGLVSLEHYIRLELDTQNFDRIRIVPNYELPPSLEKIEILRVVVRENVTEVVCSPLPASPPCIFTHSL